MDEKTTAFIQILTIQRNQALDSAAIQAAQVVILEAKIKTLESLVNASKSEL